MKGPAIALIACLAATAAHAQMKPEDQVKQRRAGMTIMGHNLGNLAAMVRGKKPYDKDEAGRSADLIAALCEYPGMFFGAGTDKGETRALPKIWTKRADFDDLMKKMTAEAKKLPQAARTDLGALKASVGSTGKVCKSCHDDFREE